MKLGDQSSSSTCPSSPRTSLSIDYALGVGGIPRGRVCRDLRPRILGQDDAGPARRGRGPAHGRHGRLHRRRARLDPEYAGKLGVDVDNLMVSQPDSGEQALEIAEILIRSGALDVVVIDSVAALVPKAELDGEMGDSHVGLQARLMSQALRKLTGHRLQEPAPLIFINQIREKIGVMFGSPETTTGGRALKFYSSMRLDIRRIGAIKDGDETIGNRTKLKVVKNKVAPPFRSPSSTSSTARASRARATCSTWAWRTRSWTKSGSWFSYGEMRLGQGRENARVFLKDNPIWPPRSTTSSASRWV